MYGSVRLALLLSVIGVASSVMPSSGVVWSVVSIVSSLDVVDAAPAVSLLPPRCLLMCRVTPTGSEGVKEKQDGEFLV